MKFVLAVAALAGVAFAAPQGITADITPTGVAPAGCMPTYAGTFEITVVKPAAKRDAVSSCGKPGILTLTLAGGQLHDNYGRTGYIAKNQQFQFDKPPQDGAIYTGGFSLCGNGTIALGGSTTFYECQSGGFYNLYNENVAAQCSAVEIMIIPCDGSSYNGGAAPAVTQSGDGQPEASSAVPVSQISDAQPQAPQATTVAPVSEFSDGQPQMPTPVSEYSDGQPQAPATATAASSAAAVSQIGDGQPQAGNATATVTPFKGAGNMIGMSVELVAAVAGVAALAVL